MFLFNGKRVRPDVPFIDAEGIQYHSINALTPQERADLGITEVQDPTRPDDRFYFVTENDDGTFLATPKGLPGLKVSLVLQSRRTARTLLATNDWYLLRFVDDATAIPNRIKTNRIAIRAAQNQIETALTAAADVAALAQVNVNAWPDVEE